MPRRKLSDAETKQRIQETMERITTQLSSMKKVQVRKEEDKRLAGLAEATYLRLDSLNNE